MEQTLLSENEEMDYTTFYAPPADASKKSGENGDKKEKDPTRTGQVIDMMNSHNLGTTLFCLIPDKILTVVEPGKPGVPRLYRKVQYGYAGRVQDPDSENSKMRMNIQIPRVQDFTCELTQEQKKIINHLRDQAKNFKEFVNYKNKKKFPSIAEMISVDNPQQILYCYGRLNKFISADKGETKKEEAGHVRIFKFAKGELGKNDFATALNGAISNKINALGSSTWMKNYFNREAGQHDKVVSVKVDQSKGEVKKYSLTVSLEETAPFEITKEDLEVAGNLNSRVFDITKFDEKYYEKLGRAFEAVQSKIDSLSK